MVRKEDRKEKDFAVLTDALKLTLHTIQVTSNPKVFIPQYSNITGKIVDFAISIYHNCKVANRTRLVEEFAGERKRLQNQALSDCAELRSMVEISKSLFHIRTKRIKYWTGLITTVENRIRKWKESDSDRLRKYK